MALGARRRQVLWMMIRESAVLIALGLGLGVPLVLAAMRLIQGMLFGAGVADPPTVAAATAALIAVAVLAAVVPALRASRVDPMVALRYE